MARPLRVLIVEDSEDDAQLVLRELRRGGYEPIFERVETPEQMQAALKQEDWEVILCDYALPGFIAPKALELLTKTHLDIPFIVVSGKIGEQTAVEMMRAGAHDYVMKDNLTRLVPAIVRELREAGVRRDRKRAEEEIADLAKFPGENPGPVLRIVGDGTIMFANKAAQPLLKTWSCRAGQALPKRWAELVASVLVSGAREDVEIDCEGQIFLLTFAPVVEAGYVNLYGRDITERKQVEEALRASEEKWRSLVEGGPTFIMIISPDGTIQFLNRAVTGHRVEDTIGKSIYDFLEKEFHDTASQTIQRAFETGTTGRYECKVTVPGVGTYWYESHVGPLKRDGRIISAILTSIDITDRKQADEEVRRSRRELRALAARLQIAREEERIDLARKIHDDVGHSLAALKMDLAWLNRRLPEAADGPSRPMLKERLEAMSKLLAETIQTARETASELRPGLLDDVGLAAAIEWEAKQFQRRTGVKCTFTGATKQTELDREQSTALFRICQELLTNIASHAGASAVRIALKRQADQLILEVSDNGKGIKKKQVTSRESLGILGMRERALVLSGEFSIWGKAGKGTTATVQIPLSQAAQTERH